jgi:PAS domain S-box-containing protein
MSQNESPSILIVDDNRNNIFTLHTLINEHIDSQIFEAESGTIALQTLLQENVDLIILDVQMPNMDGFETAKLIRSRKKTQHIPIVFLTAAYKSEEFKQKGFAIGAADYLTKPIDTNQLISRIKSYLRFIEQERLHNAALERKVQERTAELLGANQQLKQEIAERKLIEDKLQEARNQLEQRVQERTAELSATNQQLQNEINERKLVEEALERLSRQNQLILESAGEGILSLDLQENIILVNPAAAKMLGYEVDELIGCHQHTFIHHTKKDGTSYPVEECLTHAVTKGNDTCHRDDEVFWRKNNTAFAVEYMTTPILENGQIIGTVMTFRDITERKQAEAALQDAKNSAENARAIAEAASLSKSQFLANMSHELRTPLNAIIGYTEMLVEDAEDIGQEDFIPDLQKVHVAGTHLLGLISDVLDLSKIEAGKMELCLETFDINTFFGDIINTIQPLMEKRNNTITITYGDSLGEMYTDMVKLRQILLNLLSNAAKFTEKSLVSVEVNRETQDDNEWIRFVITDDGIGMTQEQRQKLFQPFMQADSSTTRKYGGTGLGLTITKEFTEMMGGVITVVSEFGHGSMFTILLPAFLNVPPAKATETEILLEGSGIVLVIDDDGIVREQFKNYLGNLGYAVAVAADGKEGLRLAEKLRPDAIILDIKMPRIDGWKILSKLKSNSLLADIPVTMMSVEESLDKGFALGAADYLVKPIHHDQLVAILDKYHIGDNSQDLIMIVEDDTVIRELIANMLKNAGLRIFKAENGKVALEHIDSKKPTLILLDLRMPVMDGFEFLVHLRENEKWQSIPVVVLTSSHLNPQEQACLQGGNVETIFQKESYDRDELLLHIHELIASSKREVESENTYEWSINGNS